MADVARLNVEIDRALDAKLTELIPRGLKSTIVRTMLEILVDDIEKNGRSVIGDVLDKKYSFTGSVQNLNVKRRE